MFTLIRFLRILTKKLFVWEKQHLFQYPISGLMLPFRLALQTFDAKGIRYLDSQLVKKRIRLSNMTPNNITQNHTLLRRCSQP